MRLTNKKLARLYKCYNKKYFKNKLPEVQVKFASLLGPYQAIGHTHYEARKPILIGIDRLLRTWSMLARMTLLHEMAHVNLPYCVEHGPRFEREMRRLARLGAFTGLW